jgi:hypothetical protein
MTVASLLRGTVGRRAFAGHGPNELGAAEAAVLSRWIVVVLACLGYSRSELRVGGENIRVRKRKRSYPFHQRWGANFSKIGIEIQIPSLQIFVGEPTASGGPWTPLPLPRSAENPVLCSRIKMRWAQDVGLPRGTAKPRGHIASDLGAASPNPAPATNLRPNFQRRTALDIERAEIGCAGSQHPILEIGGAGHPRLAA